MWYYVMLVVVVLVATSGSVAPVHADATGQWGRTVPIADPGHPNLFWNQAEITRLRQMVLVDHQPAYLWDLYRTQMQGVLAAPDWDTLKNKGFGPAITYMLEPTTAKANAIRSTLLTYMAQHPLPPSGDGIGHWYSDACFCGWPLALMFDLIQAYHPTTLSPSEKATLKNYFLVSSQHQAHIDSNNPQLVTGCGCEDPSPPVLHQGKLIQEIPNWYTREMGMAVAFALLGGDQAEVDFQVDSGWPHTLFTFQGVTPTFPPDTQNRYDMLTSILAVYPDGADIESYTREGYDDTTHTWKAQQTYSQGAYHFAQMSGPILGAIMAWRNGMQLNGTGPWGIATDGQSLPNLQRNFRRAIQSRTEADTSGINPYGHPTVGWEPLVLLAQRFYSSDSTITNAVPGVLNSPYEPGLWELLLGDAAFLGQPAATTTILPQLPAPTNLRVAP